MLIGLIFYAVGVFVAYHAIRNAHRLPRAAWTKGDTTFVLGASLFSWLAVLAVALVIADDDAER
jgi:hypothetical protein